ncbi:hypothetical protein GPA10_37255 [Streptomyces sp. p1417]|uniref:Tn3 transposase DDE domain-containing protein n=1 Tax=Streptomyces typhae TaxID=2681492 RepID=A0A6L6X8U7_9ACTN|nr:hypothetical protein [Streptomyces typhae]MVO90252.1 hypothetical protein [Streptomyces typhae]
MVAGSVWGLTEIRDTLRRSCGSCWTKGEIAQEDLAHVSPYLTEHINRVDEYFRHELGIQPEAYDPKLDLGCAPLREQDLTAASLGQAA